MNDRAFLSVFTPSRTPPEDLEAITVQRQALIEDAVARVRESAMTGNKHHLLFVGPRGTGKTHLVTLLVHRLGQDRALDERLRIAWLNEDETSTSLLELLRRIYEALVRRYPEEFAASALEPLFDLRPDEAEGALVELLLNGLQQRTLLVLVENLDGLFEGLGEAGQQKLRAFIQEHPVLSLVATAQRLVDDIAKRHKAFFGFFQTEHLKNLSVEQARELLRNIAKLHRQSDVVAFLDSATGRSRIRALHHLSGGNHRIYIVLSQFITRDSIEALVDPFAKMVDEMTPYYQERIRWLPTQQRKIVGLLCTRDRPTPVKEIARRLFATQQTISSQLKDLRSKGYVQAAQRGRESLYEIAEPMMRICVEVKDNRTGGPLRVLVDFLRVWYDGRELNARLSDGKTDRARALVNRGGTSGELGEREREIADYSAVIDLPQAPVEQIAQALLNRGLTYWQSGDAEQAQRDLEAISTLERAPLEPRVDSLLALAKLHVATGRWDVALAVLGDGLRVGASAVPAYRSDSTDVIGAFFDGTLQPAIRRERALSLFDAYRDADAVTELGEALTRHLGRLHADAEKLPSPDNLEIWAAAWEEAAKDIDAFRLPLRIFRTGVDFLKAGGTDPGILLDLNQEERKLLEQVFDMESGSEALMAG